MSLWIRYNNDESIWEVSSQERDNTFFFLRENFPLEVEFRRWIQFRGFREKRRAIFDEIAYNPDDAPLFGYSKGWGPGFEDNDIPELLTNYGYDITTTLPSQNLAPTVSDSGKCRLYFDEDDNKLKISENGGAYTNVVPTSSFTGRACRVYRTSDKSISDATATAIDFDAERYDNDSMHDNSTNNTRITIQHAGLYHVGFNVQFAAAGGGFRQLFLQVNGSTLIAVANFNPINGSNKFAGTVSCDYTFAVNDYVEAYVYQDSGGNLTLEHWDNYSPEFWCHKVSD